MQQIFVLLPVEDMFVLNKCLCWKVSNSTGKNILMASNDFQEKMLRVGWHTKYNAAISFGIPSLYVNLLLLPSAIPSLLS